MAYRSRYSFSSITSYRTCPAAWKQCYVDDDPGVTDNRVDEGACNHEGIARYGAVCYKPKPRKYDREAGYAIADSYPEPVRTTLTRFVESWQWEWGDIVVRDGSAPVEQQLTARLPGGEVFSGHIDLLRKFSDAATEQSYFGDDDTGENNDLWRVTDFKTRSYRVEMARSGSDDNSPEYPLQLLIYAWLTQSNYPEARNFELQFFTLQGYPDGPWQYAGDLSWVGDLLQARLDEMDADSECRSTPGEHCARCFHRAGCPLNGTRFQDLVLFKPEDFANVAFWHDAMSDFYRNLIRQSVDNTGRDVNAKSGWFGYKAGHETYTVTNYGAAVDLLNSERAKELLENNRARLSPLQRLLKVDQDVAGEFIPALVNDGNGISELARATFGTKPAGKPRYGFHKYTDDTADEQSA